MFTGIVEEIGVVVKTEAKESMRMWDGQEADGFLLVVQTQLCLQSAYDGASVSINGVCLTVTKINTNTLAFGCTPETLRRTNLGALKPGDKVNMERSAPMDGRNSGHFVQGHVDTTGEIKEFKKEGESLWVKISVPDNLIQHIVPKGYIAIDGTSLTVCEVNQAEKWFNVMLVAFTQNHIILPNKDIGSKVNLEVDVIGKYVSSSMESFLLVAKQEQENYSQRFLQASIAGGFIGALLTIVGSKLLCH